MKSALVKEWMTPNPICASPSTTLPQAHQLMKEHRIRRLPIVDKGELVGIVTRGDVRGAEPSEATSLSIFELNYLVSKLTLDTIMTRDPVTVTPNTTLGEAARLMLFYTIAGLPVMDNGKVIGIITESDIFRMVVKAWEVESTPMPA